MYLRNSWFTGTVTHKIVFNQDLKPKRLRNTGLKNFFFIFEAWNLILQIFWRSFSLKVTRLFCGAQLSSDQRCRWMCRNQISWRRLADNMKSTTLLEDAILKKYYFLCSVTCNKVSQDWKKNVVRKINFELNYYHRILTNTDIFEFFGFSNVVCKKRIN